MINKISEKYTHILKFNKLNIKFIREKIHSLVILSKYSNIFCNFFIQDLCDLLVNELYHKILNNLKIYKEPYILSFCKVDCIVCNKNIINECYSCIIDNNFGWNYCNECSEIIDLWSSYYFQNNKIFPINYIENIDIFKEYYFYRKSKKTLQHAYINYLCKYIKTDKDNNIYVCMYWDEKDKTVMEWVSLKNLYDNNILNHIFLKCPIHWNLDIYNYWNKCLYNIKN